MQRHRHPSSLATAPLVAWSRLGGIDRPGLASGRRFVIVHLDGVSRETLSRAMQMGYMPTLSRWLESGERVMQPTLSGIPASTPAFQATLFYGEKGDCPGYQWYDKARSKDVRMDDAAEVLRLEQSLRSLGKGLLHGGSTYFSLIGGGAKDPAFAMSRLAYGFPMGGHDDPEKNGWDRLASLLAHTVPFVRAAAKMTHTALVGSWDSLLWSIGKRTLKNEPRYMLNRLFLAELGEEVTTYLTLLDICRGVPAIYSVYAGYDEVAHRRGPSSAEALSQLMFADRSLELIDDAIRSRPEFRYELYILSDHGQEKTRPVEDILGGMTLAEWILSADREGVTRPMPTGQVSRRTEESEANAPSSHHCSHRMEMGGGAEGRPPLVVADAGDLAHVYFDDSKEPYSLDDLTHHWPRHLGATIGCPAAGIVAVRGGRQGFAFHEGRRFDLSEPKSLQGILQYDGEILRRYISELLATPSSGDIVVFGAGTRGGDIAYAWEFGSHGGVGAGDIETFLIHPANVDGSALRGSGPEDLHRFFRERFIDPPSDPP